MPVTRRHLLGLLSGSTFFLTVGRTAGLRAELPANSPVLHFPQGVASGDPQPDSVMLWTRAVPADNTVGSVNLLLQVSVDANFSTLLLQEQVQTGSDADYTVRAHVDGLTPGTHYYYRFLGAGDSVSRIGRTRTAPDPGDAGRVNMAFTSCQSFEQAYYGGWARLLQDDRAAPEDERIQFVLHLGDFIYERSWHKRIDGRENSRKVPPFPDGVDTDENRFAVSLEDYRHLYKTYLQDAHLQEARANWPFICTWDDHEFANDNFQSYSMYGPQPLADAARKQCSNQAWFEYIPAALSELHAQPAHDFQPQDLAGETEAARNRSAVDSLCIYRKLGWGRNLDIILTDSRSYRSAPCLPEGFAASLGLPLNTVELVAIADGGTAYNNGQPPAILPYGDGAVPNPGRDRPPGSMLGKKQRTWFLDTLASSSAPWKLWGNALPLIPMRLDMSSLPLLGYQDSIYNIDGWAGYPHEVSIVMNYLEDRGITGVVSLAGDHHMHGAGTVSRSASEPDARPVAVDFTVAGLSSSPVFEDLLAVARADHPDFAALVYRESGDTLEPVWHISMLEGVLPALTYAKTGMYPLSKWLGPNPANPGLRYVDTTVNGYGLASFDRDELRVRLVALEDCRQEFTEPPDISYIASFRLPRWRDGESPQLAGPEFSRGAPFPFAAPATGAQ